MARGQAFHKSGKRPPRRGKTEKMKPGLLIELNPFLLFLAAIAASNC
jgi:hypothetical protein